MNLFLYSNYFFNLLLALTTRFYSFVFQAFFTNQIVLTGYKSHNFLKLQTDLAFIKIHIQYIY